MPSLGPTRLGLAGVVAGFGLVLLVAGAAGAAAASTPDHGPEKEPNGGEMFPSTCADKPWEYSTVSEEGPYSLQDANESVVTISSAQDGEPIQMGLIRPNTSEEVPVIVRATPYTDDLSNDDISSCWGVERLAANYVQHGYAVAVVAVRGTGGSGGCFHNMGPAERRDLNRSITFLGTREWSNGNVGMSGMSYDGATQWEVAAMGNPHLETVVPMGSMTDPYEMMYRNGAVSLQGPGYYLTLYHAYTLGLQSPASGTSPSTYASRAGCPEYAGGYAASGYSTYTGERDPTGYWADRNLRPLVEENYEGSVFLVHGFRDENVDPSQVYPWIERLEEDDDVRVRYMLGQWNHTYLDTAAHPPGTRRTDWADILLKWWDQELKGKDVDVGPGAYVQDSTGEWRSAPTWPPTDANEETWYLRADGNLSRDSTAASGTQVLAVDPDRHEGNPFEGPPAGMDRDLTPGCRGCARFETMRFDESYRFAGEPDVNVTVTPTGPHGYVTATLYAVDESGNATKVGWGMTDVRHGDRDDREQTVVPGQPVDVSVPLQPLDVKVPAGSKLVLVLHQGTEAQRSGSTPLPLLLHVGSASGTFDVAHFEANANPSAAPDPSARATEGG